MDRNDRQYGLTFTQKGIFFDQLHNTTSFAYNIPCCFIYKGDISEQAIRIALGNLVENYPVLSTRFVYDGSSDPYQEINLDARVNIEFIRMDTAPDILELEKYWKMSFNVTSGEDYLYKLYCILSKNQYTFLFIFHHLIVDGISTDILLDTFYELIDNAPNNLTITDKNNSIYHKKPINFLDFVSREKTILSQEGRGQSLEYWTAKLNTPKSICFDYRKRYDVSDTATKSLFFFLDKEVTEAITHFSSQAKSTKFNAFLSCLQILLYRYQSQDDISIAVATDLRGDDFTSDIGCYTNTIILRQILNSTWDFNTLVQHNKSTIFESLMHRDCSLFELLEQKVIDRADIKNLLRVVIAYQIVSSQKKKMGYLFNLTQLQDCDIGIEIIECAGKYYLNIKYNACLFSEREIHLLYSHYCTIALECCNNNKMLISDLNFLTEGEILIHQNLSNSKTITKEFVPVHITFEWLAKNFPDKNAVITIEGSNSYKELNESSNKLANYIQNSFKQRAQKGIVVISIPRSIGLIECIIAVMKTGNAYLYLDPAYPDDRISYIIEEATPIAILTDHVHLVKFQHFQCPVLNIRHEAMAMHSNENLVNTVKPDDIAYVVYTSGSTGRPKGVLVNHGALFNLATALSVRFGISSNTVTFQFAPYSFDASVPEIWNAFTSGGAIFIPDIQHSLVGESLSELLIQSKATDITLPPSILATIDPNKPYNLRTMVIAGESCTRNIINQWVEKVDLINAYGPSEATVCAATHTIRAASDLNVLGLPLDHVELYVLDKMFNSIPAGCVGELYVGGCGVGAGYLKQDTLTSKVFIEIPHSKSKVYKTGDLCKLSTKGDLIFHGREDNQIKLRGQRIELQEIKNCIIESGAASDAVVIIKKHSEHDNIEIIVAYVVLRQEHDNDIKKIRGFINTKLPDYMKPSRYVEISSIPLTLHGKIDYKILYNLDSNSYNVQRSDSQQNTASEKLVIILTEILEIKDIDIKLSDNFFDIGGNSLLALKAISLIKKRFNTTISVQTFFEAKNLEELVETIFFLEDKEAKVLQSGMANVLNDLERYECKVDEYRGQAQEKKKVLLTGATGFLGRYLLKEILLSTNYTIYCLINSRHGQDKAIDFVNQILKDLNLTSYIQSQRVKVISGDLKTLNFGIPEEVIEDLSFKIDSIYHCAAEVNHLHVYDRLRDTNVFGTEECIKFALKNKSKQLHYISTIDVVSEKHLLPLGEYKKSNEWQKLFGLSSGYSQTKWTSEQILYSYILRQYPFYIYRPGNITGSSDTGFCLPAKNHALMLLKGFLQSSAAPIWDAAFELTPVDTIASAILKISMGGLSLGQNVFNLHNRYSITWKSYLDMIVKFMERKINFIEDTHWRKDILPSLDENNAIYPIKHLYETSSSLDSIHPMAYYDSKTLNFLIQNNVIYPDLLTDPYLTDIYLKFLIDSKFLIIDKDLKQHPT